MNPTILFVDDDDAFQGLLEHAFARSRLKASLQWVCDGELAISYLSREGRFQDETAFPDPALVLLDLKMPRVNGFDVLQWKLGRPELSEIPVVVLSSSDFEKDRKRAAELGARHYLAKPPDFRGLIEVVETLDRFWNITRAGLEGVKP